MQSKSNQLQKSKKKTSTNSINALKDQHPDHASNLKRLNRVKGQIDGIEKMILDRRYCPDIITQLRAASAALKAVEAEVLKAHLRGCVKSAFNYKNTFESEEKIQEILKLIY